MTKTTRQDLNDWRALAAKELKGSGADTLVSCDMSCLMHIGGALHREEPDIKIRHLAQILDTDPNQTQSASRSQS